MQHPRPHFQLKADMALRGLTLREVAKAARVPYTRASEIINGRRIDPIRLAKLINAVRRVRAQEVAA